MTEDQFAPHELQHTQLSILNHPPTILNGPRYVHQLFERHAQSLSCAIDHLDQSGNRHTVRYVDLDRRSTLLAERIRKVTAHSRGARTAIIPVLLPQSPELYISLVAILKAGAAFCPINLDAPSERIKFILQDVGASSIVTTIALEPNLPGNLNVEFIHVDLIESEANRHDELDSAPLRTTELCYCMYTSGSTGIPKGVLLSHGAVVQSLLAHDVHIPKFTRFLQMAAPTFDVAMFEIFFTLFRGATIISCDRSTLFGDLPRILIELEVDAAELTPTVVSTLLQSRPRVPNLECLLTIGEMLTRTIIEEFGGSHEQKSILYAMYGPTEAAIHCTLQPLLDATSSVGSIGRPLDTVSAFIMSFPLGDEILPVGKLGELVCGGFQLAEGYLNRPETTKQAFVEHKKFGRLYRTGDKCRMLPDGSLEILGRVSAGQVKLRGQRIELGEVEQVVARVACVRSALAIIIEDNVVIFALKKSGAASKSDVFSVCEKFLPRFMIPTDVVLLDEYPCLPSGKADKKTLETEYMRHKEAQSITNQGPLLHGSESEVIRIANGIVPRNLSPTTPLKFSGMDSLRAIRFVSELRPLGYRFSALDVLNAKNIRNLLSITEDPRRGELFNLQRETYSWKSEQLWSSLLQRPDPLHMTHHISDVAPLTPLQAAMLAETVICPQAYCNSYILSFSTTKTSGEVKQVFRDLATKNDILLSGFIGNPDPEAPFVRVTWNGLSDSQIFIVAEFKDQFHLISDEDYRRPFRVQIKPGTDDFEVLIQIHHALYDGWSWDLLLDDLHGLLMDESLPKRPRFCEAASYFYCQGALSNSSSNFWSSRLKGVDPIRFSSLSGKRVQHAVDLSVQQSSTIPLEKLKRFASLQNIHPQVFFQGALAVILSQYTGSRDVVIGTVSSGRTIPVAAIEQLIGPCIAMTPLRVLCDPSKPMQVLLHAIQEENRAMMEHSVLPLKLIKEAAGLEAGRPLFDVLLVWQETLHTRKNTRRKIKQTYSHDYVEQRILLEYEPRPDSVCVKATFKNKVMSSNHMDLLLRQLHNLVNMILDDVEIRVGKVCEVVLESNLSVLNHPPHPYRNMKKLSAVVEERAESSPERPAVEFAHSSHEEKVDSTTLTYSELNSKANKLAHFLVARGITPKDIVGLCMDKSVEMYVSILAITKTGACYVPIAPDAPIERLRFILRDADVKVCLSTRCLADTVESLQGLSPINVDDVDLKDLPRHNLDFSFCGEHTAYIIYTSGTTGDPKGVMISQSNLANNLSALSEMYPVSQFKNPRLLQSCSQAFDVSVFEIFFTWYTGMCLCSAGTNTIFSDIEGIVRNLRITHLSMTPTVATLVNPRNVPTVGFLIAAGETLTDSLFRKWAGKGLWNGYGPSEMTNVCTVQQKITQTDALAVIGPPLRTTSAFVVSVDTDLDHFQPLLKGSIGELCFGGSQVFQGYTSDPELTSRKIVEHPRYGCVYRTGDLGRINADGSILFAGRIDDQVKIRGQRVELTEISTCILRSASVEDCSVLLISGSHSNSDQLNAFLVLAGVRSHVFSIIHPSQSLRQIMTEIFRDIQIHLPKYMQPTALIPVSRLPTTAQGKVDKRVLVSAFNELDDSFLNLCSCKYDASEVLESPDLVHKITDALSKTINVAPSDLNSRAPLYRYGIDSLSAISFARHLRDLLGIPSIDVSKVLQNPSIAQLSVVLKSEVEVSQEKGPTITSLDAVFSEQTLADVHASFACVEKVMPATPLQEAMLAVEPSSTSKVYYNCTVFVVNGKADRLKEAWRAMISRHQILRTVFHPTAQNDYAFVQVVQANTEFPWVEKALKTGNKRLSVSDARKDATSLLNHSARPFQLTLISSENPDAGTWLVLTMHHALYDGVALSNLLQEVERVYFGENLPPSPRFESFIHEMLCLNMVSAENYWRDQFSNFEPIDFPDLTGKSPNAKRTLVGSHDFSRALELPLQKIEASCREQETSLLSLCQATWAELLAVYTGELDVCFGNVVSGRTLPINGIESLVAPCFNTLPVRLVFDQNPRRKDMLKTLTKSNADSLPFQLTPLRRIQSWTCGEGRRLFDSLIILQHPSVGLDKRIWSLESDTGDMDIPIVCELLPNHVNDTLSVTLHCRSSLVLEKDTHSIFALFQEAFISYIHNPADLVLDQHRADSRILAISNPRPQLLHSTDSDVLHSHFLNQVRCKPHNIALDFWHDDGSRECWTFSELNERSNSIASVLHGHGVKIEEAIPICVPKSLQFYASILAVLKVGAAFTPVDNQAPSDRKILMVEQLNARLVLCMDGVDMSWCAKTWLDVSEISQDSNHAKTFNTDVKNHNLAYRIYTSGSTGQPKAVSIEHRQAVETITASSSIIPWSCDTRILNFAATTFDMCYYDIFMALSHGFCLCAATQKRMLDNIVDVINGMDVSMLDLTPSVASTIDPDLVRCVDYLYCIGEALPQGLVDRWSGKCVNSYGPTEAAMCVSIFPTHPDVKSTIIGTPFPTTSFTVIKRQSNRPAPVFGVGELCLGGSQIARGYYTNEDLTAHLFVQHEGWRIYKTGDLVRMLGDGNFEFLGRVDDQVKIRGQRIELEEISNVIKSASHEITAVSTQVLKVSDTSKDQIVSFLAVRDKSEQVNNKHIESAASKEASSKLPDHMVPKAYIILKTLPFTASGKIDKKDLSQVYQKLIESDLIADGHFNPEEVLSSQEKFIRDIFLGFALDFKVENIHRHTSIYALGLDSITAAQIAARLRQRNYHCSAADVLERPTVSRLAEFTSKQMIDGNKRTSHGVGSREKFDFDTFDSENRHKVCSKFSLSTSDIAAVRPCTPLQNGILAQSIHSKGTLYLNHMDISLNISVNLEQLRDAWDMVLEKHEMLRTGFMQTHDSRFPFAMITYRARTATLPFSWTSLFSESRTVRQKDREDLLHSLHRPSWRVRVFKSSKCGHQSHETSRMVFLAHHALYDAHSLSLIFNDLAQAYRGRRVSPSVSLEPALSHVLISSEEHSGAEISFWGDLGKRHTVNKFPNLNPLRDELEKISTYSQVSSSPLSELEAACRDLDVSMQAVTGYTWALILSQYVGNEDVTFGTVLSGRSFEDAEDVTFPLIATLPSAVNLSMPASKTMKHLTDLNALLWKYQFTSLNRIKSWMGLKEEQLFDNLFVYQKRSMGTIVQHELWEVENEYASADYAVSIEMLPADSTDVLEIRITTKEDLVPLEQSKLIVRQFDAALAKILNPSYSQDLKTDSNIYSYVPPVEARIPSHIHLLHDFVRYSACTTPSRTAFEFVTGLHGANGERTGWNYRQLDEEGNRIANFLISKNVRQGSLIAVCFEKCPEASFAMLGILKAGCGFLAIDPGAPYNRKSYIMEDSQAPALITMGPLAQDFENSKAVIILNMDDGPDLKSVARDQPRLERPIQEEDVAYCLYTSGTTGKPKGCLITHLNVVQALLAFQRLFHWNPSSRFLQFASFHFDVSVMEQYWSWSVGIACVSAPRDLIFEDLAGTIRDLRISHIDLTPSLAQLLRPEDVPTLCTPSSVFITGGEALKQEIIATWGSKGVIYNGYGPTEATIGCTMYARVPANGKSSNIGSQFLNVGTYVLDPNSTEPVLRGAPGELCVFGPLVAKGYLNRTDLTTDRFPILPSGERVYRTGDMVRLNHDNTFMFLGRADDQVKLRGQRLEIGEINSLIKHSNTAIVDVATLVTQHKRHPKEQLVSFIAIQGAPIRHSEALKLCETDDSKVLGVLRAVRGSCEAGLPGYMVPSHLLPVSALPLSANNKVDINQLKHLFNETPFEQILALANANQMSGKGEMSPHENQIARVLCRILDGDNRDVSRTSSIFELGLDSITVIPFASALRNEGYKRAQTSTIMKNPRISTLATILTDSGNDVLGKDGSVFAARQVMNACEQHFKIHAARRLGIEPNKIESIAPCTPLQEGIISRTLESETSAYYTDFRFDLDYDVNLERLRCACMRAVLNLQILRTRFTRTERGLLQVVLRDPNFLWQERNFQNDTNIQAWLREARLQWVNQNAETFGSPVEMVIAKSPSRVEMSLHIFHALYDGNSLSLLLKCIVEDYHGKREVAYGPRFHDALPHGPLRQLPGAKDFWVRHLQGITSTAVKPLIGEPAAQDTLFETTLSSTPEFEDVRRSLNATHQALVQACWIVVLHHFFQGAVTVGTLVSGRSIDFEGADKVIGPLFNSIPFHLSLNAEDSWVDAVRKCQEFNIEAIPFQHTSLRNIKKWCSNHSFSMSTALFEAIFVFQKETSQDDNIKPPWTALGSNFEADYPLAFEAKQTLDGKLTVTLAAQAHIADEETVLSLVEAFEHAMTVLLKTPASKIGETFSITGVSARRTSQSLNGFPTQNSKGIHQAGGSEVFSWVAEGLNIREAVAELCDASDTAISPNTSILQLGLDSIDIITLSSRLRERYSISLPVSMIVRNPTIAEMIRNIQREDDNQPGRKTTQVKSTEQILGAGLEAHRESCIGHARVLPATPLQEAMIAQMQDSNYHAYFNHDVFVLNWNTDTERMKCGWQSVIDSAPILRTGFAEVQDARSPSSFAQIIHHSFKVPWNEIQLSDQRSVGSITESIRGEVALEPLCNPSLRLTLVRNVDVQSKPLLILSIAHALYDGFSLELIHNDVQRAYHGRHNPGPSSDRMLADILAVLDSREANKFWRFAVEGLTPTTFPQRKSHDLSPVKTHRKVIPSRVSFKSITNFCKIHSITISALAQTCWSLVLASKVRKLDVAFGVVLSGREDKKANQLRFPTMNTVISRSIIHGSRKDLAKYTQENTADILDYQHFPLRKVKAMANGNGDPIFDTLFIFQRKAEVVTEEDETKRLYKSIGGASDVEYPVCVEAEVVDEKLIWRDACHNIVLNDDGSAELLRELDAVLTDIIDDPDAPAASFDGDRIKIGGLDAFVLKVSILDEGNYLKDKEAHAEAPSDETYWSEEERIIRRALAAAAGISEEEVTKDSSLQHIGLDSISAIKVSSALRKVNMRLRVSDMMKARTVRGMAAIVAGWRSPDAQKSVTGDDMKESAITRDSRRAIQASIEHIDLKAILQTANISRGKIQEILPASPGQVHIMSAWQNTGRFFSTFQYHLRQSSGGLRAVQKAWISLVKENPILRTLVIATSDPETVPFVQVILKSLDDTNLPSFDSLENNPQGDETVLEPHSPLIHLNAKTSLGDIVLTLHIHHVLYDGVSLPLLLQRLEHLLSNPKAGIEEGDDFASRNLNAYREFLGESFRSSAYEDRQQFWSEYLKDVSFEAPSIPSAPLEANIWPTDNSPSASNQTELFNPTILDDKSQNTSLFTLTSASKNRNLSLQAVFLGAYAQCHASLLARSQTASSPQNKDHPESSTDKKCNVLLGVYLANRAHDTPLLPSLPYPTLNLIPLLIRQPLTRQLADVARDIQNDLNMIGERAGRSCTGLWEKEKWIGPEATKVRAWINFLKLPGAEEQDDGGGVHLEEIGSARDGSGFARVVPGEAPQRPEQAHLGSLVERNAVRKTYSHRAIDIEAGVREIRDADTGEVRQILSMGVFAPTALLPLDEARRVVDEVRGKLVEFCGSV